MEQYSPQYGTGYSLLVRSLTPWDIIRQSIHSPQLVSEVTNIYLTQPHGFAAV